MGYIIGGPSSYTETSSTLPYGKGFGLGDSSEDQNGAAWRYVQAGAAVTQYDTVVVDENYQALPITKALADDANFIGFAQVAFASADYGWVMVGQGKPTLRIATAGSADATLWTSDTAGVLTSVAASASHFPVFGIRAASNGSAGGVASVVAVAAYPVVRTTNA